MENTAFMQNKIPSTFGNRGSRLFSYAVIADTHINHGEKETNSVYPVNALHNARFRHVVNDINNRPNIEFVIHLGDLVHPVPAIPKLFQEASLRFKEITDKLKYDIHVLPGNHDVGDKVCDWTPAVCVSEQFLEIYRKQFGQDYFAFNKQGLHFIMLNAQIINSGLTSEKRQREWLENYFIVNKGKRFIVNIHYPPYLTERNEGSHYDNIDEPGRTWLLQLFEKYNVEALFTAHVHNFWYHRHSETDCYFLPSTAFVRQDFSEINRAPPDRNMEGGRNDYPKLGYFLVHIHQQGHICEFIRTFGKVAEPQTTASSSKHKVSNIHPIENSYSGLGFDMRQDWMDIVQIPPSGGPDEFNRKLSRNDYPLLALWEMGIRRIRIPKLDVQDTRRRERLLSLKNHGHEFILYTFGIPEPSFLKILIQNSSIISAWEISFPWIDLPKLKKKLLQLQKKICVPVYLSKLREKEEFEDTGSKFVHAINHGFIPSEEDQISEISKIQQVEGVVFRIGGETPVWENVIAASKLCAKQNIRGSVIIRMSKINPSEFRQDDLWTANRVCEAIFSTLIQKNVNVIIDTFADFDRGFFRRNGVVDRLYNPRLGFHAISHLYGALNNISNNIFSGEVISSKKTRSVLLQSKTQKLVLVLPQEKEINFDLFELIKTKDQTTKWSYIDLKSGEIKSSAPNQLYAPMLLLN